MSTLQSIVDRHSKQTFVNNSTEYVFNRITKDGLSVLMDGGNTFLLTDTGWTLKPDTPEDLDKVKEECIASLNYVSGEARRVFLTDSFGMDLMYVGKALDAEMFRDKGYPEADIDNVDYTFVKSRRDVMQAAVTDPAVTITGQEACTVIIAGRDMCKRQSAKVEDIREIAINAINISADKEEAVQLFEEAHTALLAITL